MPSNFELKARCADLARARERAQAIATHWLGVDEQVDTYFRTPASGGSPASEARSEAKPSGDSPMSEARSEAKPSGDKPVGRLKLRESSLSGAQLVPYLRPDAPCARRSDYVVIPVPEPERTKALLSELLGVYRVVKKRREIALYENVRIHLDRVDGLGDFVELEAVWDGGAAGESEQREKVTFLREQLGIRDEDLVASSYEGLLGG